MMIHGAAGQTFWCNHIIESACLGMCMHAWWLDCTACALRRHRILLYLNASYGRPVNLGTKFSSQLCCDELLLRCSVIVLGTFMFSITTTILTCFCSFGQLYIYFRHAVKGLFCNVYAVALIGGSLFFLQQFAGINGVLYFSSLTFRDVGITSGALASLYVGITNFGGALVASNLMDKQGRKKLLIGSYLGMAFAMFLIVYGISFPLDEGVAHSLSIAGTLLYIFTFALGAGPVTGIIIPELSSARTRSKVMGFSFTVHWICNFLVGLYFLELVNKFGVGTVYAGFGGVSLLTAVFAYNFIVETKGRSLEEIEMSLSTTTPGKQE